METMVIVLDWAFNDLYDRNNHYQLCFVVELT